MSAQQEMSEQEKIYGLPAQKVMRLVNIFVCTGASVVIFGAMAKILHLSWADWALKIGLTTEAVIFLIYAILPPEGHVPESGKNGGSDKLSISVAGEMVKKFDEIFANAGLTQENLSKLSTSFQKLGATVDQIGQIGDVVKATSDFSAKTGEAAAALGSIKDAAVKATESLGSISLASDSTNEYHKQVQGLAKNLGSLNTIYELELQESNNHLKALNQFYGKLAQASEAMNGTAEDALKAKEQIGALANNLGKLNQVYGNMLTAMQGR
jgi:gliding motility-associated protein GldL